MKSRKRITIIVLVFLATACLCTLAFCSRSPVVIDTSMPCGVHEPVEEGPLYLVCIGSGSMKTVDAYGQQRLMEKQEKYGYSSFGGGNDEGSGSSYTVMQLPDDAVSWVSINNGNSIISSKSIHPCFCEDCAEKISNILPLFQRHTYVLYDAIAEEYHPIAVGTKQIGNYIVEVEREDDGYHMVVTTLA